MIPVLKRVLCLFLAAALLCLAGCGAKQETLSWQEQYDLGVRYLSEGKYEEAVLAFEAAIKIDPKRPEAYAGLADAYLAAGDEAAAKDALDRGFAATGDEGLQNHLEGTGSAGEDAEGALFQGPYLVPEDVEFLGMTLEDASALALADGVYDADDASIGLQTDDFRFSSFGISLSDTEGYTVLQLDQHNDSAVVNEVQFNGWREEGVELNVPIHARGLHLGDNWEQVLEAVGFSQQEREIIGGPQDVFVTRETTDGQTIWRVGFSSTENTDGAGEIIFFYRDEAGERQADLRFVGGALSGFYVWPYRLTE